MNRGLVVKEASWLITVLFAMMCYSLVVWFGTWLNPDLRTYAFYIWLVAMGVFLVVWVLGVYGHLVVKGATAIQQ